MRYTTTKSATNRMTSVTRSTGPDQHSSPPAEPAGGEGPDRRSPPQRPVCPNQMQAVGPHPERSPQRAGRDRRSRLASPQWIGERKRGNTDEEPKNDCERDKSKRREQQLHRLPGRCHLGDGLELGFTDHPGITHSGEQERRRRVPQQPQHEQRGGIECPSNGCRWLEGMADRVQSVSVLAAPRRSRSDRTTSPTSLLATQIPTLSNRRRCDLD